ncbi:hypothetical protein HF669_00355 [Acidithiobacillus thiooxidans]|uniref:hypothetical protein n=1 Tax=Acidithiobacillus thiooxidans TaxID=930 RepID=UPI000262511C|nr:hypothetical protein [Acidithiobacillus thiooxidans]MBU2792677.1 hypothetical protein [Acidithiobacillus thiooxidans]MBU2809860.1 hypothetical protein [Acidithiobacillus thiooxidans]
MPEHTGLPAIPALDAGQEDWILAWRKALGAYAMMAGYSDYIAERWGQEMAEAYLGPAYRGSPEDQAHIRTTAQRLGPIYPPREKSRESNMDLESCPVAHAESKQDAEAQLDMFEDLLL